MCMVCKYALVYSPVNNFFLPPPPGNLRGGVFHYYILISVIAACVAVHLVICCYNKMFKILCGILPGSEEVHNPIFWFPFLP